MIYEIDIANSWLFGNALPSSHRLRHDLFVRRAGWSVPVVDGMEYDQFDTLATKYLVGRDPDGTVRAVQRCLFCDGPYMLRSLWPQLAAADATLPTTRDWVEGTRAGIDQRISLADQGKWRDRLIIANIEWSLRNGCRFSSFVTYKSIVDGFMVPVGYPVQLWGSPVEMEGGTYVAGFYEISEQLLLEMRERLDIPGPVLVPLADTIAASERVGAALA